MEFFNVFYPGGVGHDDGFTEFLRNWQRDMIHWGDGRPLSTFIAWKRHWSEPDADAIFLLAKFIKAMGRDLGLSNHYLRKGTLAHLAVKNPELFLTMTAENLKVMLADLAEKERQLRLD